MTRDQAIEIARAHAKRTDIEPYHEYQPTPEMARDWMPHEWVISAILTAHGAAPLAQSHSELAGAVLALNRLWNTIAEQMDLCRRLAKYTPQADPDQETDATRFRWLTEDHDDAETRTKCRELLGRLGGMGRGSARADIDSAMADDIKRSMLRTADAWPAQVAARTCGAQPHRQNGVAGLMKLVNQLRAIDAPRPETTARADRLFDEIDRAAHALAGIAIPATDHSRTAIRNSERG